MAKQTKADLQKEVDDLQQQIDQLTKRRGDLFADRDKVSMSVKAQKNTIATALLEGRDITKDSEVKKRNEAQLEALDEAITQADDRLRNLNTQHASKQKSIVKFDFDQVADEACNLLLECLDQLSTTAVGLDTLEQKFLELNRVGAPAGFNSDHDDNLRLVRQICRYLRGADSTDGINYKLKHVETSYPNILKYARGRKK